MPCPPGADAAAAWARLPAGGAGRLDAGTPRAWCAPPGKGAPKLNLPLNLKHVLLLVPGVAGVFPTFGRVFSSTSLFLCLTSRVQSARMRMEHVCCCLTLEQHCCAAWLQCAHNPCVSDHMRCLLA